MKCLRLLSGKSFAWDGERFHRDGDCTPPSVAEVEELSDLLLRHGPEDHCALEDYLRENFREGDVKRIRRAVHAVEWTKEGPGCRLRSIAARDLKEELRRGEMRCIWCGEWLPDEAGGRGFCSNDCFDGFRARCDPGYIRGLVEKRDRGVCAICGAVDTYWEMDHILPVSCGGGLCDLSNYQTLCADHHDRKTAEQQDVTRASSRPNSGDNACSRDRPLALSESPPARLRDLAAYIRALPLQKKSLAHRLNRLLACSAWPLRQVVSVTYSTSHVLWPFSGGLTTVQTRIARTSMSILCFGTRILRTR